MPVRAPATIAAAAATRAPRRRGCRWRSVTASTVDGTAATSSPGPHAGQDAPCRNRARPRAAAGGGRQGVPLDRVQRRRARPRSTRRTRAARRRPARRRARPRRRPPSGGASGPPGPAERAQPLHGEHEGERRGPSVADQQEHRGQPGDGGRRGGRLPRRRVQPGAERHGGAVEQREQQRRRAGVEEPAGERQQHRGRQAAERDRQRDGPFVGTPDGDQRGRDRGQQQEQGQLAPPLAGDQLDQAEDGHDDAGGARDRQEQAAAPAGQVGRGERREQHAGVAGERHRPAGRVRRTRR